MGGPDDRRTGVSIAAGVVLGIAGVPQTASVVLGLIAGTLVMGLSSAARKPGQWVAAAVILVAAQLGLGVVIFAAVSVMSAVAPGPSNPAGGSPVAQATFSPQPSKASPTAARPTLTPANTQVPATPSASAGAVPFGQICTFSKHPSVQVWWFVGAQGSVPGDCAWIEKIVTLDKGETLTFALNGGVTPAQADVVCTFTGKTDPNVKLVVTDSAAGHSVGTSACAAVSGAIAASQ